MSKDLVPLPSGTTSRQDFGGKEIVKTAERETAAVQARERAMIEAEYLMSERHPRNWMDVRANMLDHCIRPRFAEITRYAKPVGRKRNPTTGEWEDQFATGWTARFAETLRQEMGNIKPVAQVVYDDDAIRIVRIGVIDLQKNIPRYREITFSKAVEKRGSKLKTKRGEPESYGPPEGRTVISTRINSYGEMNYIVVATDDEMRNKMNSEESKTQRDFTLALCPRDILEDCLDKVTEIVDKEIKEDPQAAILKALDQMKKDFGLIPSEIERYIGRPSKQFTLADIKMLRGLYAAMRDGQTTFAEALKDRWSNAGDADEQERNSNLEKKMEQQSKAAESSADKQQTAETPQSSTAPSQQDTQQQQEEPKQDKPSSANFLPPWPNKVTMRTAFEMLHKQLNDDKAFYGFLGNEGIENLDVLVLNAASAKKAFADIQAEIADRAGTQESDPDDNGGFLFGKGGKK